MKIAKKIISCMLAVGVVASVSACGPKIDGDYDDKANNIYIQAYTGGVGVDWLNAVVEEFNQKYYSEDSSKKWVVTVLTTNNKDDGADFYNAFKAGTSTADIYFTSNPTMWSEMIGNGYLLDLTDVYNSKPDGENGKTVKEKLANADSVYTKTYTKSGVDGIYGLPYAEQSAGMIVNKEVFVKNGWFTYADVADKAKVEEDIGESVKTATYQMKSVLVRASQSGTVKYSDVILSTGKDGKYGTFDDGQPTTLTEWNEMMDAIKNKNYKAFIWSGKYTEYTNHVLSGVLGQYLGADNMKKWLSFGDEEYTFTDESGKSVTVNSSNRANSYKIPELKKALEFFSNQLAKNAYSKSLTSLETHTDTQGYFIYGESQSNMEKAAILCDGIWWENEAKSKLEGINKYGVNEYTFLFAPEFEGQTMAGTDSCIAVSEAGAVFARNTTNSERAAKIKEFMSMTCSDKYLKHFTKTTSCIRPFDYELSDEDLAELTPFGRNCWEIYHSENVHRIIFPLIENLSSAKTGLNGEYQSKVGPSTYVNPISAFVKDISVDAVFDGMYTYYSVQGNL